MSLSYSANHNFCGRQPHEVEIVSLKLRFSFLFLSGLVAAALFAQDGGEDQPSINIPNTIEELSDDVLRLFIKTRVLGSDSEVLWDFDITEWTIPGRGVDLHLNGGNIVVDVEFIPFRQKNRTITLVAQGEAWVRHQSDNKMRYQTSIKSIPINSGSSVIFYPLGVNPDNGRTTNLELEITISEYRIVNTDITEEK